VGVDSTRLLPELDSDQILQALLEEIRCHGAVLLGLAQSRELAREKSQATPKIALIAPPAAYRSSDGKTLAANQIDLLVRAISMGNTHRTVPGTVSMCTAVAAAVEGTVVYEVARTTTPEPLRIGHPAGVMEVGATVIRRGSEWYAERVTTQRTARRIMEGSILVPHQYLNSTPWFATRGSRQTHGRSLA
jgi:2-methylaconitate cis-trans-isomerase PrpF